MSQLTLPFELWEGFGPSHLEQHGSSLTIELTPSHRSVCHCGASAQHIHDTSKRTIKEQAILGLPVTLIVPVRRVVCHQCGIKTKHISWLKPFARITERLANLAERLLPLLDIKQISKLLGLHWYTLNELDKARLQREVK